MPNRFFLTNGGQGSLLRWYFLDKPQHALEYVQTNLQTYEVGITCTVLRYPGILGVYKVPWDAMRYLGV